MAVASTMELETNQNPAALVIMRLSCGAMKTFRPLYPESSAASLVVYKTLSSQLEISFFLFTHLVLDYQKRM
jgi:CBS-domain-containing membrane protein